MCHVISSLSLLLSFNSFSLLFSINKQKFLHNNIYIYICFITIYSIIIKRFLTDIISRAKYNRVAIVDNTSHLHNGENEHWSSIRYTEPTRWYYGHCHLNDFKMKHLAFRCFLEIIHHDPQTAYNNKDYLIKSILLKGDFLSVDLYKL